VRFYFPYDRKISRAMERIRKAFIQYAPQGTEFVNEPAADTIHCIHYIGQNPREDTCKIFGSIMDTPTLPKTARYIIFQHFFNFFYPQYEADYRKLVENALLIITHTHEFVNYPCQLIEVPWGYEPETFYVTNTPKRFTILTTGYVASSEAIDAVFKACYSTMTSMVHVGGKLDPCWVTPTFTRFENQTDDQLRELYNQARFVSGMRREPSYEMPIIEGYACGAQPICFKHAATERYFKDFAIFVPNKDVETLTQELMEIFRRPIEVQPKTEILERFYWRNIMDKVWSKVTECAKK